MQFSEAQAYLCNKLNIDVTDVKAGKNSLFSLQDITDYLNLGLKRAWDYKPWTFTEKTLKVTIPSNWPGYMDYPNNFEDESISRLIISGVAEFRKKDFADYEKFLTDYPSDTSQIWSEHERFVFINGNAISAGQEADVFGKLRASTLSGDSDLLPFSPMSDNNENSGNMAIVLLAYADALSSEKKKNPTQSMAEEKKAFAILDNVWKPMAERKAAKTSENRGFFTPPDYFAGNRNRSNTNIGNFP